MTNDAHTEPQPIVLVAWDGSPAAAKAFPLAQTVATQLGAGVEVLHVSPDGVVDIAAAMAAAGHGEIALHIETGEVAATILAATERPAVAMVVLTTHGREIEPGGRLGRVAREVIARTSRPVLLVRPVVADGVPPIHRLLMPLDGTPKTATALQPATSLAHVLGASIDFLYVAAPGGENPGERGSICAPRYVDQPQHAWPEWAGEVMERLASSCAACPAEVPTRMFLAQGEVAGEIARFAIEHQSDAIVLVRRSRFQPDRAAVLRAVLRGAPCPILLLPGAD